MKTSGKFQSKDGLPSLFLYAGTIFGCFCFKEEKFIGTMKMIAELLESDGGENVLR